MNARIRVAWWAVGAAALLSACAGKPPPAPVAAPVAPPPPPIVVDGLPPPPSSGPAAWSDVPLTPGDWSYASEAGGSEARFGPEGGVHFSLRCNRAFRQITIAREGATEALWVRTTYGLRTLPEGIAALDPADALFDEMAFSRGRFAVESDGDTLIIPAWPELARVIEDCRG